LRRTTTLLILGLIAAPWAACLIALGLWLAFEAPDSIVVSSGAARLVGVSSIAAGNLVFMFFVADRLFPTVQESQLGWSFEMFTLAVLVVPLALLGVRLL